MGQLCLWTKIHTKQCLILGCVDFSMYACEFSVPQMRKFCLFTYPPSSKWASFEKMILFVKIDTLCKSTAGPLSEANTHWMVNWFQLLNKASYQGLYVKFVWMMSPKCSIVENDGELMLMALHTHTFCYSSNILRCTHCFWLFMLRFIDEYASFFTR